MKKGSSVYTCNCIFSVFSQCALCSGWKGRGFLSIICSFDSIWHLLPTYHLTGLQIIPSNQCLSIQLHPVTPNNCVEICPASANFLEFNWKLDWTEETVFWGDSMNQHKIDLHSFNPPTPPPQEYQNFQYCFWNIRILNIVFETSEFSILFLKYQNSQYCFWNIRIVSNPGWKGCPAPGKSCQNFVNIDRGWSICPFTTYMYTKYFAIILILVDILWSLIFKFGPGHNCSSSWSYFLLKEMTSSL